uniref:Uncharacterized protein n=1 Tax=Arundo donax TaxID=35708 RepID=A0A0A9F1M4_ARUDO
MKLRTNVQPDRKVNYGEADPTLNDSSTSQPVLMRKCKGNKANQTGSSIIEGHTGLPGSVCTIHNKN